jgi:hypothetical protein
MDNLKMDPSSMKGLMVPRCGLIHVDISDAL